MKVNQIVFDILKQTNAFIPVYSEVSIFHVETSTKISFPTLDVGETDSSTDELLMVSSKNHVVIVRAKDLLKWYMSSCKKIPDEITDLLIEHKNVLRNDCR